MYVYFPIWIWKKILQIHQKIVQNPRKPETFVSIWNVAWVHLIWVSYWPFNTYLSKESCHLAQYGVATAPYIDFTSWIGIHLTSAKRQTFQSIYNPYVMGTNKFCIQCKKGKQIFCQWNVRGRERDTKKIETNSIYIKHVPHEIFIPWVLFHHICWAATKFDCVFCIDCSQCRECGVRCDALPRRRLTPALCSLRVIM